MLGVFLAVGAPVPNVGAPAPNVGALFSPKGS